MDLRNEAERRARAGDGTVAGLLAIIKDLESEIERKDTVISEWESGVRTRPVSTWGYDG